MESVKPVLPAVPEPIPVKPKRSLKRGYPYPLRRVNRFLRVLGVPHLFYPLLIAFALGILALEIFVPYRHYARVLKFLTLSLLAYIITGLIISPDWRHVLLLTIIPTISLTPQFLTLVVAI